MAQAKRTTPARGAAGKPSEDKNQRKAGTSVATRTGGAVARTGANAVARSNLDAGGVSNTAGMEGTDKDSFAIPFLAILQKMSPQLDRNAPEFIKGAKEGDILNTASQEVYDGEEGIILFPVHFKRSFVAWTIREKGGGFKGEFEPGNPVIMDTVKDAKNRDMMPDGQTHLADTRLHGCILLNGGVPLPVLISMSSTQIKKSKRWMSAQQAIQQQTNQPTFLHGWKATTVPESNDKGSWMGWQIEPIGPMVEIEHRDAAVAFYHAVNSGSLKMRADTNQDRAGVE